MKERMQRFMAGRYGNDQLNQFIFIVAIISMVLEIITRQSLFYTLTLVLLILAFGLCATAWNPGEFSGDWYCAETGELFRFQDGLVSCEQHNLLTGTIDAMCGAYCFDRDSVTVFSLGVAGLENPRQLYLIHGTDGDRLCGSKDGSGETYFYRSQQAALEN